jgi:tetratricopeptide (TPR) repeat protein
MAIWTSEIKELEKLYESLKGQLPDLEKELERLIKADDENMILLYSRRCLEVIITDLCECELKRPRKTEPLQGIIDKLHKEEKIPSHIIASMHGLNELSTYGAHPKDFDPKQVRTTLINLETIIEWYFKYKGIDIKGEEEVQFKGESLEEVKKEARIEEQKRIARSPKQKLLSGLLITAILVMAAILAYPKIFKRDTLEKLRSSGERIAVAVMPFQNMSNDTIWNVWQSGIQDIIVTYLSNSPGELKVRQTESVNGLIQSKGFANYASITPSVARNFSKKLGANIFVYGSINQSGATIRINAKLTDSRTEDIVKSFQVDGTTDRILPLIDSLSRMISKFLIITKLGKDISPDFQSIASTNSPEAYRYLIYGDNAFFIKRDYPSAIKFYSQAVAIDSNFTAATIKLSWALYFHGLYDEAKKCVMRVYQERDQMPMQRKLFVNYAYAFVCETPYDEIKYLKQVLEFDDQMPFVLESLSYSYEKLFQYDKEIPGYEKALKIYKKWGSKPPWIFSYVQLGTAYHKTGQYKKERKLYKKAEQDFPDDNLLIRRQATLSLTEGDEKEAKDYIDKYISIRKENSASEAAIATSLAGIYSDAGILDKAEEYYRQALTLEPGNPDRLNNLAWFLIDMDQNINKGMDLIDKALKLSPDTWYMLDTKGWGLYKQKKYKEALELLEKSWDLKPYYDHELYLHLEAAKKAVAGQKNN